MNEESELDRESEDHSRPVDQAEKEEMIEFLRQSREDIDAGRTIPAQEFLAGLGQEAEGIAAGARLRSA